MKKYLSTRASALAALFTCFILNPFSLFAQAKDMDIDVDINKGGDAGSFFTQPWVWIVGGAVFILLLVALMRGRGGKGDA